MKFLAFFLASVVLATPIEKADHQITCDFKYIGSVYFCEIIGQAIPDNENLSYVFVGNHLPGLSNYDVQGIQFFESNFPIIPSQVFSTFMNVRQFLSLASKVQRLRSIEFALAGNLRTIGFFREEITRIPSNAFFGASSVTNFDIKDSDLQTIDDEAFAGMRSLRYITLINNQITTIAPKAFAGAPGAILIDLSFNELETLNGEIFSFNQQLRVFSAPNNRIRSVGKTIFNGLGQLETVNLRSNVCTDWSTNTFNQLSQDEVNARLQQCFA
jgi:hypothetical protein